jgi:hypothetical protein
VTDLLPSLVSRTESHLNLKTVLLGLVLLSGCNTPQETIKTSNSSYRVELLFEHDGAKVYRFEDGGTWVYYAVGPGVPARAWVKEPEAHPEADEAGQATAKAPTHVR